ncbi:MAG: hypothetical protein H0V47_03230 [Chloroflexia bacterium]|nr:hypothetical protein [Chloroflexia bacterium]
MFGRLAVAIAFMMLLAACGEPDEPATEAIGGGIVDTTPTLFPTISADPAATPVAPALA